MKKFLIKCVFWVLSFLLLIIIIFLLPIYTIMKTREYYNFDKIIKEQQDNNILVGFSFRAIRHELKYFTAEYLKPNILAVGTSRVLQFRDRHFKKNTSFYNAGLIAENLRQYIDYLNKLNFKPKIIILGLDQYFFNKKYAENKQGRLTIKGNIDLKKLLINSSRITYSNISLLRKLSNFPKNIGLGAVVYSAGFRSDGSYLYQKSKHSNFKDTIRRIKKGNRRFEYGYRVYLRAISQVKEILNICYERDIYVVAIIPPYAPFVYEKMKCCGKYVYIDKIYESIKNSFARYGFELYDFTNMTDSTNDTMYIDGFHGNEEVYGIILQSIKKRNSRLSGYIR